MAPGKLHSTFRGCLSEMGSLNPPPPKGGGPPWERSGNIRGAGTHLHPNDGVDEEEHGNQQTDIGQGLVGRKAIKNSAGGPLSTLFPSFVPLLHPHGVAACCARVVPGLVALFGGSGRFPLELSRHTRAGS